MSKDRFLCKVFLNVEKGKNKCSFLNGPLSFYTVLSTVVQSSGLISPYCNVFFFLVCVAELIRDG